MDFKLTTLKSFLLCGLLTFCISTSFAQGTWATGNIPWVYDFGKSGGKLGNTITGDNVKHVSTSATPTFLPSPTSGSVVAVSKGGSASFALKGKGETASLTLTEASAIVSPVKFGAYEIPEATPIMSLAFTLGLDVLPSNTDANWYVAIGSNSGIYNDNTAINISGSTSFDRTIFAGFRLIKSARTGDNFYFTVRDQPELGEKPKFIAGNSKIFQAGKNYDIEIYCNNARRSQKYKRAGEEFDVAARTYHIWVNGKRLLNNAEGMNGAFQASGIRPNQKLDSFAIMGRDASKSGDTFDNSATATISKVSVNYSDVTK